MKNLDKTILPYGRKNYMFLIAGVAIIIISYFLMATEDFIDATEFSLALWVCPILLLIGFILVGYSIMVKDTSVQQSSEENK